MNYKEKILALTARWLREVGDHYGNHICNDVESKMWDGWTLEERQNFVKQYEEWNGTPEDYNPAHIDLFDWQILDFLAFKISTIKPIDGVAE